MAHLEKFTRQTIGNVLRHDARQAGQYHSNENIDNTRTPLNYNLAHHDEPTIDFINDRISQVRCLKRDDVVVLGSWCVTLPKDYAGDEKAFFTETYNFLCDRYGEKNVVSAWVHKDEVTPHLHFKFIPIVNGKNGEKVCMKECCGRKDLQKFHTDLKTHLESRLGTPCNVLNGATVNGNKTIIELKTAECAKKLLRLEQKVTNEQVAGEIVSILGDLKAAMQQKGFFGRANRKEQFEAVLELATKMQTAVLSVTQFTSAYTRQLEEVFDFSTAAVQKARKAFISEQKSQERKLTEKEKSFEAEKNKLMAQIKQKERELDQRSEYLKFNEAHLKEAVDLQAEERATEIARKTLCRVDKYAEYIKTSASFEKRYREHFGRSYEDDLEKHSLEKGEER